MSPSTIRNIIIALIIFSLAGASAWWMVYQLSVKGDELGKQVETLQEHRAQEASYYRLQKTYIESKEDREELMNLFVLSEGDSIDFLNEIEALSVKIGLSLKTNGVKTLKDEEDDSEWIEIGYEVEGSRERIKRLVQILEQIPYVSRVLSLDMKSISKTEWKADVVLRVKILAYEE